jgi:hypothetical protein
MGKERGIKMEKIYKYRAYWIVDGKEIRIFPKSKKVSRFETIEEASKRLKSIARYNPMSTRGIVRDWLNNEVLTIAL